MIVYLLHFATPLPRGLSRGGQTLTCGHYLGSTDNLEKRLEKHHAGHGARLMEVCAERGVEWTLARTWEGGRTEERKLKARKEMPRLCPICNGGVNYRKERSMSQGQAVKRKAHATVTVTFTVDEVFAWVCQRQGVRNPEHLSDARWRFLWNTAERTAAKINALFAGASMEEREQRSARWSRLLFTGVIVEA